MPQNLLHEPSARALQFNHTKVSRQNVSLWRQPDLKIDSVVSCCHTCGLSQALQDQRKHTMHSKHKQSAHMFWGFPVLRRCTSSFSFRRCLKVQIIYSTYWNYWSNCCCNRASRRFTACCWYWESPTPPTAPLKTFESAVSCRDQSDPTLRQHSCQI